jgi:hypothetical protein
MPVPSQGHYGFPSFPVVDWFCLFIYLWVLTFPLEDCSQSGNFVIVAIHVCILKVREWLENLIPLVDYRYRLDSCNELGLWCLTPLSTIFQLFCGGKRSNQKIHRPATSYWQTLSHNVVSSTLLTGFSTALTTILPLLFQYCFKCCYSDSRNLWTVMRAGGLAP